MPIPEALAIITASAAIAKNVYSVTIGVHAWFDGVKHIDSTIRELGDEVDAFRATLQSVERSLSSEVVQKAACIEEDRDALELWCSLCDTLKECRATTMQLRMTLAPLNKTDQHAILRKFKLDVKDLEIRGLKDQLKMHNRRLTLAIQMVQLRVSCATPNLITSNITSQISSLRALMNSQMEMMLELTRNPSTNYNITGETVQAYASSLSRSAQTLMSTASTIYKGSDWSGSIKGDDPFKGDDPGNPAVVEWLEDTTLSELEFPSNTAIWSSTRGSDAVTTAPTTTDDDDVFGDSAWRAVALPEDPEKAMEQQRIERYLQTRGIANIHALDFDHSTAINKIATWHLQRNATPNPEMNLAIKLLYDLNPAARAGPGTYRGVQSRDGLPLLHVACCLGWHETFDLLLRDGASPDVPVTISNFMLDSIHMPDIRVGALHLAASEGHIREVRRLLEVGAALKVDTTGCQSVLHHAAFKGHVEVVEALLDANVPVDEWLYRQRGETNRVPVVLPQTALHSACAGMKPFVVKALIQRGCSLEVKNLNSLTPLGLTTSIAVKTSAARAEMGAIKDIIDSLIAAGAVVDKTTASNIRTIRMLSGEQLTANTEVGRSSLFKRLISQSSARKGSASVTSTSAETTAS